MPVRFEGKSEYQGRFEGGDPNDPPLPAFYQRPHKDPKRLPSSNGMTQEPAIHHRKPVGSQGVPQDSPSYMVLEPPIQRKKKPIIPHGSNTNQEASSGEYVLLGSQEKFTANIVYKAKPAVAPTQHEIEEEAVVKTPVAPRPSAPPAPKVVVDTGVPAKLAKTFKDAGTNGHLPVAQEKKSHKPEKTYSKKPQEPAKRKKSPSPSKPDPKKSPQQYIPKPVKSSEEPKDRQVQNRDVPETNGTSGQKEVTQNDQEAPADYAMKYKAGIAPHWSRGPKRLSEYQMQYAWKKAVGASPLLDAEQVVYKSSTQLVPTKAQFAKTSEYRKQYQSWDVGSIQAAAQGAADSNRARMKRSKSVDARLDRQEPAGTQKMTAPHDPRLVQESLNPQRLHFPHGPQKKELSEYTRNFMAPNNFLYDEGVWKGAMAKANTEQPEKPATSADAPPTPEATWYAEVLELRTKADEYKKRARGTHFSREHVAQLLAQQNELWDTASTSSVLSALSLERPVSERSVPITREPARPQPKSTDPRAAGKRTAWGHDRDPLSSRDNGSLYSGTQTPSAVDQQSEISDTPTLVEDQESEPVAVATPQSLEGRLPTPVIPDSKRHHLDRTTPLVGGALLSSPPAGRKAKGKRKLKHPRSAASTDSGSMEVRSADVEPSSRISQSQVCCTCGADNLADSVHVVEPIPVAQEPSEVEPQSLPTSASVKSDADSRHTASVTAQATHSKHQPKSLNLNETQTIESADSKKAQKRQRECGPVNPASPKRTVSQGDQGKSPTYDSSQFQKAMDALGQMQTRAIRNGVEHDARLAKLQGRRGKKKNKMVQELLERSLPPRPAPAKTRTDTGLTGSYRNVAMATSILDDDLSLAERVNRQIQIGEDLRQTSKSVNSLVRPTYGKPTPDAHFLLADDASMDRPMSTKFVSSPPRPQNVGQHNRDRFPGASIPSTIHEGGAATYKANGVPHVEVRLSDIPPRPDLDDDVLSLSARSVASSCSLASDVLDRARQRHDNFWQQKRNVSGKA